MPAFSAVQKKETLLNAAFRLFTTKGINKTSISEIAEASGIAKGTFYLYFTDKYDIRNKLIAHKSSQVFRKAAAALEGTDICLLEDKIIFIADHILDQLSENQFISHDICLLVQPGQSAYRLRPVILQGFGGQGAERPPAVSRLFAWYPFFLSL